MAADGACQLMPPHDVLALDWSRRSQNTQPLRCCKPRLLGSNGWTQSLKPLLLVAAMATTTMSSNILHKALDPDIDTPSLGPPSHTLDSCLVLYDVSLLIVSSCLRP
jgi:hypothetical protein